MLFGRGLRYGLVATRANGQPASGIYVYDPHSGVLHANGLMVLALAGRRISAITRFGNSNLARFGLPRTLDASDRDGLPRSAPRVASWSPRFSLLGFRGQRPLPRPRCGHRRDQQGSAVRAS